MTWLKLDSKRFDPTRVRRADADMEDELEGYGQVRMRTILNPNIVMMGSGLLINRNIIFWKIFQNICWSFVIDECWKA